MTRQKKELWKRIDALHKFIEVDRQLGCGFAPAGFYDPLYEEIYMLEEKVASLSHYESAEAMRHDERWLDAQMNDFPFA